MIRRALLTSSTVLLFMVPVTIAAAPAAHAGGGCHAGATSGRGDAVALRALCFEPTTLYVEPGTTVTFTNDDATAHTVTGHAFEWGDATNLLQGGTVRATFATPGVYAYSCIIHPGMVGTIVVGDAAGALVSTPTAASPSPDTRPLAALRDDASGLGTGWAVAIGVGAALVGGAAALVGRRAVRRRAVDA